MRKKRVGIINLMPNKQQTEYQYLELFGSTSHDTELVWIRQTAWKSRNVSEDYLNANYQTYAEASKTGLDGLVVTGAPIEHMAFEHVAYWKELQEIFDDSSRLARPTICICWAAQAGMYHFHDIEKHSADEKVFGVFQHEKEVDDELLYDIKDPIYAPHSRHTYTIASEVKEQNNLTLLLHSKDVGVFMVKDEQRPFYYITGHMEYDTLALDREYHRDRHKGFEIDVPHNYYIDHTPSQGVQNTWSIGATQLFDNWIKTFNE